jgi:hypothetical protein
MVEYTQRSRLTELCQVAKAAGTGNNYATNKIQTWRIRLENSMEKLA